MVSPAPSVHPSRIMPTYPPSRARFVRGHGSILVDDQGNEWLDFLSGLAVTGLGHAHPAVTEAVCEQAATLTHVSNLFETSPAVALADDLARVARWPDASVFLAQCGATANEAALKLARRHGRMISPDKVRVVALEGGFHGRTLATLEATGQPAKHVPYEPLLGYVDHVPFDDADAMSSAVGDATCAVLLEVIQGEGGVRTVPDDVLRAARQACDEHDSLLIVDEVQTGIGRTGSWFAFQSTSVQPDVITLAKALGNGLPIGACVARGRAATVFGTGDHATTFGGNPVTCAAARAVISTIESEDLIARANIAGQRIRDGLAALVDAELARAIRGRGLLIGIELAGDHATSLEAECDVRRLVTNAVASNVLRLAPPLTVSDGEIDRALSVIEGALRAVLR